MSGLELVGSMVISELELSPAATVELELAAASVERDEPFVEALPVLVSVSAEK